MKMYTNESQTAKLIDMGFVKPKSIEKMIPQPVVDGYVHLVPQKAYSIGELMEFCPTEISSPKFDYATISIFHDCINWVVGYDDVCGVMRFITSDIELIDALCTICRKLKEEGVI